MAFASDKGRQGAAGQGGATSYDIDNSLRLTKDDSAYLSRTFSAGNQKTWTWSGWINYRSGTVSQDCSTFGFCALKKDTYCDPNGGYKNIGKTLTRNNPFIFEARVRRNSGEGTDCYADRIGVIDNNGNGYGAMLSHSSPGFGIDVRTGYSPTPYYNTISSYVLSQWYKVRLIWKPGIITAELLDTDFNPISSYTLNDNSYNSFTRVYIFGGYDYWVDQILLRKYIEPWPLYSLGAEEVC